MSLPTTRRAFCPNHAAIAAQRPASAEVVEVGPQLVAGDGTRYRTPSRWRLTTWGGRRWMVAPGPFGVTTWRRISRGRWLWLLIVRAVTRA
jgi:hypothetical protein